MNTQQSSILVGDLSGLSLVFGLFAAYFWFASARNSLPKEDLSNYLVDAEGHTKLSKWLADGARLNRWAAIWTGVSTVLGGAAAVLDHLF